MAFAFAKLIVDQKSSEFSDRIWQLTEGFARGCGFRD
jgi:hypothetical protein